MKISLIKKLLPSALLLAGFFMFGAGSANAQFNPGRIIDDGVFTNKNSMSVQDIQNFLNARVPTCDTNHAPGSGSQGEQPPWICLKNFSENGKSAAQIIWEAGQTYNINPQVILVTLQKENGLITDTWPYDWQYRTAMGMGCPDGAACDAQYFGFTNQVNQGTRHLAGFFNQNAGWYIPYRPGSSYIKWHPNSGCGGTNVNIENRATAALYSYTPYQPNAGALANMYGTGDGCSSYGNRNFWRDFTVWFGSTYGETNESNISWQFENLEGATGTRISNYNGRVGQTPEAVDYGSKLQVFYYDSAAGNLKRAYADNTGWNFETLDGGGGSSGRIDANLGVMPETMIHDNILHVYYYDISNGDLRHAWTDNSQWWFETLDGSASAPGGYNVNLGLNPTATSYGNSMQLFYHDSTNGNLRHAWYTTSAGWKFENLDGDPGSVGRKNSNLGEMSDAVTIGSNSIQLYYYDSSNGNLRHAWTNSNGWNFENLDGDPGSIAGKNSDLGKWPTLVTVNNQIQLYYYDDSNGNLRHAWTTPFGWRFENLDGDPGSIGRKNGRIGLMPKVTVANGQLYLFYFNQDTGDIRHAYTDNTGWHFGNLDGSYDAISRDDSNTGFDANVIPYSTGLQLFYYDHSNGNLRHTWGTLP